MIQLLEVLFREYLLTTRARTLPEITNLIVGWPGTEFGDSNTDFNAESECIDHPFLELAFLKASSHILTRGSSESSVKR